MRSRCNNTFKPDRLSEEAELIKVEGIWKNAVKFDGFPIDSLVDFFQTVYLCTHRNLRCDFVHSSDTMHFTFKM